MTADWRVHGRWRRTAPAGSASGIGAPALRRGRPWLAVIGIGLALAAALPPAETYARQSAFVQALQFVTFAVLTPALLALSLRSRSIWPRQLRPLHCHGRLSPTAAAASRLLPFMTLVVIWRLSPVLGALARYPALSAAELLTLVAAGLGVWQVITSAAVPRPLRAATAALAMWTIWIIAYITGMSAVTLIPRSAAAVGIFGSVADRQLAAAVLWAAPAICFGPTVYYLVIGWLGERER